MQDAFRKMKGAANLAAPEKSPSKPPMGRVRGLCLLSDVGWGDTIFLHQVGKAGGSLAA